MAKEEETVTTYTCDICGSEIESYSSEYNHVGGVDGGIDICDDCRRQIHDMEKKITGEK